MWVIVGWALLVDGISSAQNSWGNKPVVLKSQVDTNLRAFRQGSNNNMRRISVGLLYSSSLPQKIVVDYTDDDLPYFNQRFVYLFPMHSQIGCSDTTIAGAGSFVRTSFYAMRFDSLYDAITNTKYGLGSGTNTYGILELDSIYIPFSHIKPTTTSPIPFYDTIIATFHPVVGGNILYSTILYNFIFLYADTLITGTTLSGNTTLRNAVLDTFVWAIDIPPGLVFTSQDALVGVKLQLLGIPDKDTIKDSTSAILPIIMFDDTCGNCFDLSPIPF